MKKLLLSAVFVLSVVAQAFAGSGDLIVDGKLVAGVFRSDGVGSGTSWSFGGNGDFAIDAPNIAGVD